MVAYLTLTSVVFELPVSFATSVAILDLTLTSVVFEYYTGFELDNNILNLTLTSVVFEFVVFTNIINCFFIFNFNKCCI